MTEQCESFLVNLPGPDRKRTLRPYSYRLSYRNPNPDELGCVLSWAVTGGRHVYQIALERDATGTLLLHCTCADAVFREENGRFCKHVCGLLHFSESCPAAAG
jgi:hypothetical protein